MKESLYTLIKQQYVEVCKQQQIASGSKVLLVTLTVVQVTTRLTVHVFPTINFDAKTLHVCKQQNRNTFIFGELILFGMI